MYPEWYVKNVLKMLHFLIQLSYKKHKAVKFRICIYFTVFSSFEKILRLNFDPRLEPNPACGVRFFSEALSGICRPWSVN